MSQQNQNVDDWMDGAATKSASFNGPPPITWAGKVTDEPVLVQKRDFDTNEPVFWPDGRPKQMLQVNVQTDSRDPQDPDDDGKRALYLEFRRKEAVQEAIKRAGGKGAPKVGGWLSVTYTADDIAAKKGKGNPPKIYVAEYRLPDPWEAEQQAPAQGQQYQQGGAVQPPQQYQQQAPQGPVGQQYIPPAPPQQGQFSQPAPPGPDPLVAFLAARNIDANVMPREQAQLIANNLGYQG